MSEEQPKENVEQGQGERRGGRGGRGFGKRGGRGGNRGGARGGPRGEPEWVPKTNLGRLVHAGVITKLEEIYYHSIPIKEYEIVDKLVALNNKTLKEECMKIKSVQKQTKAGQRTRFKAVVAVGDEDGHIGLGSKLAKEVQNAMKGAIIAAKMALIPVRRGYWGNKIGNPHTLPVKVTGKSGSVRMRLIPAPRGTGVVGAPATKKLMHFAGVHDVFTQSRGNTDTMENFVRANFDALYQTYCYLTPDLWNIGSIENNIFVENAHRLNKEKSI